MPYVPNATNTAEPLASESVESAALEFRTLKTSVNARLDSLTGVVSTNKSLSDAADSALDVRLDVAEAQLAGIALGTDSTALAINLASPASGKGATLLGTNDAGGYFTSSTQEGVNQELGYQSIATLRKYSTGGTASASLSAALDALNAAGGGDLVIHAGSWDFPTTVAKTLTVPVRIILQAGANVSKSTDGDWLSITLSGAASLTLDGHGQITAQFSGQSSTAAAIRVVGSGNARSLMIHGDLRIFNGAGSWKYGIHATDIQDPDLSGCLIVGGAIGQGHLIGIGIAVSATPSVSWTVTGVDVYDALYGVHAVNSRAPGIEGIKLVDCDFVGVKHGFLLENSTGYSPPQFEFIGCHINSYDSCIKMTRAIQVSIVAGLYYRNGSSVGAFFEMDGIQDLSIAGGTKMSVIDPAVDVVGLWLKSTSQASAFTRVDNLHYWADGRSQPFILAQGDHLGINIGSNCIKATNGPWINFSAMTTVATSINLSRTLQLSAADYPSTVMTNCPYSAGVVDVQAALWQNINIIGASSGNTITTLSNTVPGRTYLIKCDVAGVILQHNASINLRGGVNFTFSAGDTITLYAEQSTLREIARRPA